MLAIKIIVALFLPALLVVLFTRVTYNLYVGTGLALALLIASYYKGYTDEWYIIAIDMMSLLFGFLYGRRVIRNLK